MHIFASALILAAQLQVSGAGWPAYSATGRLAVEIRGDLYLLAGEQLPVRVTSGPAIDRQPAWAADGSALVFVSDRAGQPDLWRVRIGSDGAAGQPERLTTSDQPDLEPAVAPDGRIVFTRGAGNQLDLWVLGTDGNEKQLTRTPGTERAPAVSKDSKVAYAALRDGARSLRSITIDGREDRSVLSDQPAEYPAWSPDGKQIAFTTGGTRRAVLITSAEGAYANVVSRRRGKPVFNARGDSILIAELAPDGPGYNGDPERIADRDALREAEFDGSLWRVAVPIAPDAGGEELKVETTFDEANRAELFDRAWDRVATTYYTNRPDALAKWQGLRESSRGRAIAATSRIAFDQVVYEMVKKRPLAREEQTGRAGVSSAHPLATEAGLEMLRRGGNVIDAAVAVSFALGVVEPDASGVGGYGQMVMHMAGTPEPELLEFMTRAPEQASLDNTALATAAGPALANVPGTVDAMWRAWQRHGSKKLKWTELLEPAIRLAEQGYVLDASFPTTLRRERDEYMKYPSSRALFFPNGKPLAAGDTLRNPDLAWTLKQIAQGGADAFYRGEIAKRMVTDLREKGNAMSLRDLARYYAEWRDPVHGTYRGHSIYSSAPPVSGGALLAAQLNLLEHHGKPKLATEDAATLHAQIEAWKMVPRNRIADPGLWPVDITASLSKDTADSRWKCFFDPQRALRPRDLTARTDSAGSSAAGSAGGSVGGSGCRGPAAERRNTGTNDGRDAAPTDEGEPHDCDVSNLDRACRSSGTTSFAVADADGNMVAVTQTLGTWGGNFYVTPGLGFIYNDKLRSYGNAPDAYGARLPNARHGSTIQPTLVFRGTGNDRKPLLATGAAGNAWINAAVYQIVTGVIDAGLGPQQALELPRFLPSTQTAADGLAESVMQIESGFSPEMLAQLEKIGHRFTVISLPGELRMGYGAAVMIDGGKVRAGGDPRRSGAGGTVK